MKYLIIVATLLCLASNAYSQPFYCGYKRVVRLGYNSGQVEMFCGPPDEVMTDGYYEIWVYYRVSRDTYAPAYGIYLYFENGRLRRIERG